MLICLMRARSIDPGLYKCPKVSKSKLRGSSSAHSISLSAIGALGACWSMLISLMRARSIDPGLYKCPKESKSKLTVRASLESLVVPIASL
jgi:hypothetical protein